MKRIGYIYKYTFPNGKVYIGQTRTSVEQRHYVHMSDARKKGRGCLCDVALAKYGEIKPETIETIEVDETECTKLISLLNDAEKKWIKHYDSTDRTKGYNIHEGGKITTPDQMILEEKWYEIYEREHWGEMLGNIRNSLTIIGDKLLKKHEKLDKNERFIWYGYSFYDRDEQESTTFCKYFNRYCGYEYDQQTAYYNIVLGFAWDELIADVQQTIWKKVMKNKDKTIKEYWKTAKIRQR